MSGSPARHGAALAGLLAGLLGGLFGLGLLFAPGASAHASVVSSDPADGARLRHAPPVVTITFDEPVGIGGVGYLHVTDASGHAVDAGPAFHPGGRAAVVTDRLRGGLGDGAYTASFRVVSADTHPVAGSIRFVVGDGPLVYGTLSSASAVDPVTNDLADLAHGVSYAGLALTGGLWLLLTVWPAGATVRRARLLIGCGVAVLATGALGELLLQGPYSAGDGVSRVADLALLVDTLHTRLGVELLVRLACCVLLVPVLAAVFTGRARRAVTVAAGLIGAASIATFATVGHASATRPVWLSSCADGLHLLAMSVWLGGLAVLLRAVLPRDDAAELRRVLPVFSTVAFCCVATLAVTGGYAAWRGIGSADAILTTTYGRLVVAKVVLFAAVLAVADLSRRHVGQRTANAAGFDAAVNREMLRRSVVVELAIAAVVLAVTAVLVAEPRGPEALLTSDRTPLRASTPLGGRAAVTVTVDPGVHGPVDVMVLVTGRPGATVTLTATQQRARLGPLPVPLRREAPGRFAGRTALPAAGDWDFDLVVTTSRFDATTADVHLTLH